MSQDRKLQESIDKRNAAVMELERKHRIAVEALLHIAKNAHGSHILVINPKADDDTHPEEKHQMVKGYAESVLQEIGVTP